MFSVRSASQSPATTILHCVGPGAGWTPVGHMVRLAAQLFEAPAEHLAPSGLTLDKLDFVLRRRAPRADRPDLILVGMLASHLLRLSGHPGWRTGFNRVVAVVIDSFWTDRIPRVSLRGRYDHLFVMTANDRDEYERRTGVPTSVFSWGTDALGLGSWLVPRDIDLLRIGRQPPDWDDDQVTAAEAAARGIAFQGRPPFLPDLADQQAANMATYARSKFVLAFSNRVAPARHTHREKEYITARWTDALAAGAVVAGVAPRTDKFVQTHLWPGALLDIPATNRPAGFRRLAEALADWSPEVARQNHLMALRRLDWRWRFRQIAEVLGRRAPRLEAEIARLEARIAELACPA